MNGPGRNGAGHISGSADEGQVPGWVSGYDVPGYPRAAGGSGAPVRAFGGSPVGRSQDRVGYGERGRVDDDGVGAVAAEVRAGIADELAQRVAAAEARAGTVLDVDARRGIADELITQALERWAHGELEAGRGLLDPAAEARVRRAVLDGLFGLGGLQPLLDDPDIENININGCDQVFVRYADGRRARMGAMAGSDEELVELVRQLAARSGVQERRFDPGAPMVNLQLPDGSRLFAAMAVCERPGISIRRHRFRQATLAQLREMGTVDTVLAGFLSAAVRARCNMVVAGGTGIGKTTMLIALANEIEPWERLVTIEDAFELGLDRDNARHPDVMAFQSREANTEGEGEVSQAELVRGALRCSPDRVIVGEIRGPEVVPVCNVMSQGNDGSMASIHASSARGVFPKMAAYAAQGAERLPVEATALLVASSVNLVVHLDWSTDRRRVVSGIREVVDADGRQVISNEVFAPGPDRRARPAAPLRAETMAKLVAAGLNPSLLVGGFVDGPDRERGSS